MEKIRSTTVLAGRVYLVSDELKKMVDARGNIYVALFDTTKVEGGAITKIVGKWSFSAAELKSLKKEDIIGEGYTLFLPWDGYRPEVKRVELQVAYISSAGTAHFSERTPITLGQPVAPVNNEVPSPLRLGGR